MKRIITIFIKQKMAEVAQTTVDCYIYALKDYYQWLMRNNINNVDNNVINDYFIYLREKHYSTATIRDKHAVLHAFYNWCVKYGYVTENPVTLKKPRVTGRARCFTELEIQKILSYYNTRDTFTKIRDYTIICILLATGIRRAELLNITDITNDYITVIGKGGKIRSVPVSTQLRQVLHTYVIERDKIAICPYLIVTNRGTRMTTNGLRAVFTRLSHGTGIAGKRFSPHTFRHTYATMFLKNGGDLTSLQHILGHADISTTAIYLHWTDDAAKQVNDRVNPLNLFLKLNKIFN